MKDLSQDLQSWTFLFAFFFQSEGRISMIKSNEFLVDYPTEFKKK